MWIVAAKDATDVTLVGGKARSLSRLAELGFAPPDFFVIPAAGFSHGPDAPIPDPGLEAELYRALQRLGPGPYAVRSSGQAEDGAAHSHAGQFDTVLNVASKDVMTAAAQVWRSGFSETVETYRAVKSGGTAAAPAVIVQRMIDARVAGVAFSADPVSGLRGRCVISAIAGLGERLVSGEEDGQSWVVTDQTITGGNTAPLLTDTELHAIADLTRRVEAAFGAPQDIEWAMDSQGLHILQARPITTPLHAPAAADNTLSVFDNSNIVESYPGVVSPLTYSLAVFIYARVYRAFVRMLGVSDATIAANAALFDNMLGRIDGRAYYNLGNWYRALALLPGFALNRAYMETMMGVDAPLPQELTASIGPPAVKGLAKLRAYLGVTRVGLGLIWAAILLSRTRKNFYARLNAALGSGLDLATAGPTALAREYRQIEGTLLDQWDAPLINDFLCMIAFGASRNMLLKWLGSSGLELHNDVMIGQGTIISAEPAQRIARMGRMVAETGTVADLAGVSAHPLIKAEFDAYIAKFGDRCTEELKLESIPLSDDPSQLLAAIAAHASRAAPLQKPTQDPDWAALFAGKPLRRIIARSVINWTKARVRDRENLRFERTRIFGHARRVFLALGREFAARGLLDAPRDVLWLTTTEVLGAVEGFGLSPDLRGLVALRRAEDRASATRPDPDERIEMRGPAILQSLAKTTPRMVQSGLERTATGCSTGQVTAIARVIRDPRTESLTPGEILVARHTDPGWIAVFSNASAIVVERGSLLSHSAIVARELGIPCVVGLKGATDWIVTGERLSVDGATGLVRRLDAKL
ncbi:MAG: phosphoenolpyruvate synthase [Cypionkella sp.]|uniref:PEP/pyruvate-binding domain-containing protein n=1 Tax=Cypionkella sp. TaxID=2811411 RepID=UPI00261FC8B2|nr:PEP/pyruvate-binding domain-containing protein [Cypionkella sp.]MDB5661535.1 phosphoenolpyruvate synthase [Cypionkella sp.]